MTRDSALTSMRRRVGQRVGRMTQEQARAWLAEHNAESAATGPTMFHKSVRDLTGGFNSQSINQYVVRKVFERTKKADKPAPGAA